MNGYSPPEIEDADGQTYDEVIAEIANEGVLVVGGRGRKYHRPVLHESIRGLFVSACGHNPLDKDVWWVERSNLVDGGLTYWGRKYKPCGHCFREEK